MSHLDPDAPFKSFQKRLGSHELRTPQLNDENRQRFHLPKRIVFDGYASDRPTISDHFQGETIRFFDPISEKGQR